MFHARERVRFAMGAERAENFLAAFSFHPSIGLERRIETREKVSCAIIDSRRIDPYFRIPCIIWMKKNDWVELIIAMML